MNRTIGIGAIVAVAALVLLYSATFFVQQPQNAVVVRFGKLIDTVMNEPGLHWRVPFIDHVFYIDRRIINIDAPSFTVTTGDQKRIVISAYVRYRIPNPETFYRVARTEDGAERRVVAVLNQVLRDEFGSVPMQDVLTEKRAALMTKVTDRQTIWHRHRRRSLQARRPPGGEQRGDLPAHEDSARAGGGDQSRGR